MLKMRFASQWVRWIIMCVKIVDYSVIVNNDMAGPIIPGRGLRQGDPLSLCYLFFALKVFPLSFRKLNGEETYMTLPLGLMLLLFLTFYLQMIVFISQSKRMGSTCIEEYL